MNLKFKNRKQLIGVINDNEKELFELKKKNRLLEFKIDNLHRINAFKKGDFLNDKILVNEVNVINVTESESFPESKFRMLLLFISPFRVNLKENFDFKLSRTHPKIVIKCTDLLSGDIIKLSEEEALELKKYQL